MPFLTNYSCVNGQLIETRKMNVYKKSIAARMNNASICKCKRADYPISMSRRVGIKTSRIFEGIISSVFLSCRRCETRNRRNRYCSSLPAVRTQIHPSS